MADSLILEGTTALELSARGSGSDVRSWVKQHVGKQAAPLFINNVAEPGNADTIINLHRGEVGIGTATPSAKLTVETGRPGPLVLVRNTSGADGLRAESTGNGHGVSGASVSHTGTEGASETGIGVHGLSSRGPGVRGESNTGPGMVAMTIQGPNVIEAFRINQLVFAVTQTGTVLADGPYTGPADFAEMLPVVPGASCEPGDLLAINPDGMMERAAVPGATNVAGVYSTRPGFVGDMRLSLPPTPAPDTRTWVPVAVVGVVPVKATADAGPIRPGDLLMASSVPGRVMRADANGSGHGSARAGAVVGKALQPLVSGLGTITVLLTR